MELVIISGRSGSGKSTGLHLLEDEGYYCIDNLPVSLLPNLVDELSRGHAPQQRVAACVDARNTTGDLNEFRALCEGLRKQTKLIIVWLDADRDVLLKRFSETRRRHPLTTDSLPLTEAIDAERKLLEPIALEANISVDTSSLTLYELRAELKQRLIGGRGKGLGIMVQSFGFKSGLPIDADFVFDLRMLPNPHWHEQLRRLTGRDQAVKDFLDADADVEQMYQDIRDFFDRWLPKFGDSSRTYVTISIGCTGGQHRSVYMAERLAEFLGKRYQNLQLRHRELRKSTATL